MKKFELVIPAYNEEKNLEMLLSRVVESAAEFGFNQQNFRLLLVENGSKDRSYQVMQEVIQKHQWQDLIHIVKVEVNQGYGFGLMSGLRETQSAVVGWTHADLQCDPRNAFIGAKLLLGQKDRKILVKGVRLGRNWRDQWVSRVFETLAFLILGLRMYEMNAQPKIFTRDLLLKLKNPPKTFALDLYLLYQAQKANYLVMTFDVFFPPRIHGVSNWAAHFAGRYKTIFGMIRYMWDLVRAEGRA